MMTEGGKMGKLKWVENEEMVLEETRGRVKELTRLVMTEIAKEDSFFF